MAKVYITEYSGLYMQGTLEGQIPRTPELVCQTPVTISGTSSQSAAFSAATKLVRIHTDGICSIRFGTNPVATTDCARMPANQTEMYGVNPGDKVAVISNT